MNTQDMPAAGMSAAGKSTQALNNSTYAIFDPSQKNTLIIESYARPFKRAADATPPYGMSYQGGGSAVPRPGASQPAMWQAMQYQGGGAEWRPEQGTHTTRFGRGFTRRQAASIDPSPRLQQEAFWAERQAAITEVRRAHLVEKLTFKGSGYDILTGAETGGHSLPMHHPERRHGREFDRSTGLGSDKEAFRLKDSTHRFHADARQMPSKPVRTANLVREGLNAQVRLPA
jgi:hypothetical protein